MQLVRLMLICLHACTIPCQQIGPQYQPKPEGGSGEWTPGYHGHLYNLTDDAIQVRAARLASWSCHHCIFVGSLHFCWCNEVQQQNLGAPGATGGDLSTASLGVHA